MVQAWFLGDHFFDSFFCPIMGLNLVLFSRHFVTLEGPKWRTMGLKWAHFTCLGPSSAPVSLLEQRIFETFLTRFWSQNGPF